MPRLSNQELRTLRDTIRVAKKMQEDFKPRAETYLNYYKGKQAIKIEKPLDHVVVNYILPMVEIKVGSLASNPPVWRFVPRQPDAEVRALMWQAVMPWVWQEAKIHAQLRACLKDAKLYGFGVAKVGYRFETDREMFHDLTADQFAKAKAGRPDGVLLPSPVELLDLQGQYVARNPAAVVLYDNVFVDRVSPRRFFPDPEVDFLNLQQSQWIVQQCVRTLDEVKKTRRYKGTADLGGDRLWEMGEVKTYPGRDLQSDARDENRARVTLWEVHSRRLNVIVTFAESRQDPLLVQDFPYEFEDYPYEVLGTYEVPDEWLPMGDVQHVIPIQDEKNLVRSRSATRIRRLVDKYVVNDQGWTDLTAEALKSDEEGAVVRVSGPVGQMMDVLRNTGYPAELAAHEANVDRDFSVISRQPEYARATIQQGVETATEASILREMAGVTAQDDQAKWDDLQARVGRKIKALVEQFYDEKRVAMVSREVAQQIADGMMAEGQDPEGVVQMGAKQAWIRFDRETIRAEADVLVEAGSTGFRNRALEQQRTTSQFAPLWGNPGVNQEELLKLYITRGTDFGDERDRLVQPPAPPPGPPTPPTDGDGGMPVGLPAGIEQLLAGLGGGAPTTDQGTTVAAAQLEAAANAGG